MMCRLRQRCEYLLYNTLWLKVEGEENIISRYKGARPPHSVDKEKMQERKARASEGAVHVCIRVPVATVGIISQSE